MRIAKDWQQKCNSDTAPATVDKIVWLYYHCVILHGKVAKQNTRLEALKVFTYKSGDRPVASQTNRGVRYCVDGQFCSLFSRTLHKIN